jgi:hypothetical protein
VICLAPEQTLAEPFPEIRCYRDLLEAIRARKNELSLSHETVEDICGLTRGHWDKVFGPKTEKKMGWFMFGLIFPALGIKLRVELDPEQARRMASRWERRNHKQVRIPPPYPLSAEMLERAKEIIFCERAHKANASRTPEKRSRIARIAGLASGKARRRRARANGNGHGHAKL